MLLNAETKERTTSLSSLTNTLLAPLKAFVQMFIFARLSVM